MIPEGDARLYLLEWQQSETETFLTFGYQSGGVPIRFADGSAAAEVTLSGNTISALSLRPRQYSAASSASPLLPLRRLWPSPGGQRGPRLSIGYADTRRLSALCRLADGLTSHFLKGVERLRNAIA